jgi:hypothetical protein
LSYVAGALLIKVCLDSNSDGESLIMLKADGADWLMIRKLSLVKLLMLQWLKTSSSCLNTYLLIKQ